MQERGWEDGRGEEELKRLNTRRSRGLRKVETEGGGLESVSELMLTED